ESGNDLCVAGAVAASRMDRGGVGNVGEQPQGEVLLDHKARAEADGRGHGVLAAAVERDGASAGDGRKGRRTMKNSVWDSIRQGLQRLGSFFRKRPLDLELDAEMKSHLELAVEE